MKGRLSLIDQSLGSYNQHYGGFGWKGSMESQKQSFEGCLEAMLCLMIIENHYFSQDGDNLIMFQLWFQHVYVHGRQKRGSKRNSEFCREQAHYWKVLGPPCLSQKPGARVRYPFCQFAGSSLDVYSPSHMSSGCQSPVG
jgi:hypothetical protein